MNWWAKLIHQFQLIFFCLIYVRGDPYEKISKNLIFSETYTNAFKTLEIEYSENFKSAYALISTK